MPCSQMISTNCRPPGDIDASRFTMFPAAKARIRNSFISTIGSVTRLSTITNTTSSSTPNAIPPSTIGLAQPIVLPPYGCRP